MLKATFYIFLPDVGVDENELNVVKIHRQELRHFMNELPSDEVECNMIDDEFEQNI